MHLVQLLLPVFANDGERLSEALYRDVAHELTQRFGGLTAYSRAPAKGFWQDEPGRTQRDDIVVYEVMVEELDRVWWAGYRSALQRRFKQEELVVRAQEIERL
jgi:hypothetical protein